MVTNNAINLSHEGVAYYNGTGTFLGVTPGSATVGIPIISQGTATEPVYGTAAVAGGGTGLTSITAHNLIVGNGSSVTLLPPSATVGIPLISQGSSADPVYGTALVAGGGTGSTSFPTNGIVVSGATGTTALTATQLTNGQLLIGSTGAAAVATGLSAGSGISITTGAGMILISSTATGGGLSWFLAPSSTTAAVNSGYIVNAAGVTITLPVPTLGQIVAVTSAGPTDLWTIDANAGATIILGNQTTTVTIGALAATQQGDSVYLVAESATQWISIAHMGNLTVT